MICLCARWWLERLVEAMWPCEVRKWDRICGKSSVSSKALCGVLLLCIQHAQLIKQLASSSTFAYYFPHS